VSSARFRGSSGELPPSSRRGEAPSSTRGGAIAAASYGEEGPISSRAVRYRVLVVDDDPTMLASMIAVLSGDLDVAAASSGTRALELLRASCFHVVCSDYLMPDMDGADLLRRAAALSASIGCLIITGADEYIRRRLEIRHHVLMKPVDPDKLVSMIVHLARLTEMKRSVARLSSGMRG
jgi:DNA-binding NtrC family response regulator